MFMTAENYFLSCVRCNHPTAHTQTNRQTEGYTAIRVCNRCTSTHKVGLYPFGWNTLGMGMTLSVYQASSH